ncbi:hypothetical protein B0H66DRAFT_619357 [Apodospora peruviana]|uniref:Very long-chain fatty acid transport protein n=1 Tax=Apodospora peruviana TaxID=516989 RepID=A0AAE0M7Q6_9PEZI|nr:hypothetical protein B0H66DRAFT_619357 [Apodospora peruviana]
MAAFAFLPLPVAIPAVAAAAAYVNARYHVAHDLSLLASIIPATTIVHWNIYRGRVNFFYQLESLATSKSSANRPFILFEDRAYTYAQTYDTVLRYANWLQKHRGVKKGDLVSLDFQNTDTFIFLLLALWALGAKPALINYNLVGKPLIHCVKKSTARLVFVDPTIAGNVGEDVRSELSTVSFEVVTPELEAQMLAMEPIRPPDDLRNDVGGADMAMVIYTSGTTGLPKAAFVSWAKITTVALFTAKLLGTKAGDVYYTAMPLYHSTAMFLAFCHCLSVGATFAMGRKFSTSHFWDDVRKYNANIIQYVGETCRYLLAAPPSVDPVTGENLDRKHNVRMAFGNGLRPDVWNRFKDRFGIETICEFYGATEGTFATWNVSRNEYSMGAVGRNGAIYNMILGPRCAIVDVDHDTELPRRDPKTGFCRKVPRGEVGELMFSIPAKDVHTRFQGYYGDKGATSKKVMRDVFKKGDAWFRTGDVMRWDSENRVYFSDRIGDTFRWKSENVSTAEVAHVVGSHPAVLESNVYGVELPSHEGRAGCAAVILKAQALVLSQDGTLAPTSETLKSLADHVKAGLPKYALPLFVRLVQGEALQATGTNKQQKHTLRSEGVDPAKVGKDAIFWLRDGTYQRFGPNEWRTLIAGKVKL